MHCEPNSVEKLGRSRKQRAVKLLVSSTLVSGCFMTSSVMASSKSRDSISVYDTENDFDDAVGEYEPPPKKKSIAEKKLELLSKCADSMTQPQSPREKSTTVPHFALLVEEK